MLNIYNHSTRADVVMIVCNQCLSPQMLCVRIPLMLRCTRYNIMIKFVSNLRQVSGFLLVLRFPPPILNKTRHHNITEILLKVVFSTINTNPHHPTAVSRTCLSNIMGRLMNMALQHNKKNKTNIFNATESNHFVIFLCSR